MKIQDIFKLDLNTGGGNKLFARIMNKYNVPKKEYEKVKENIGKSSSGGGGQLEYLYIKLNSIGINMANNTIDAGYKIVQVIASHSIFDPIAGGYRTMVSKYNALTLSNIVKIYTLTFLGIKLLKINEDGCDSTSLAAIVEKYPNWSVCEEITEEEYNSL